MRFVSNPASAFRRVECTWLAAPPRADVDVQTEHARQILTSNDSPDIPFRWSLNPYRGCQHACAYCYARRTHEYLDLGAGTDFETRLVAKTNAPELLARELARPKWKREQIAFSGVTDCYQPIEIKHELTRRCLAVCVERANPVGIVTKSPMVLRDVDLLQELHHRAHAAVFLSIPFADDDLASHIEPHAPRPTARFAAVEALANAGVPVGVLIAPVIPGLGDREIPRILDRAASAGASHASFAPLRLPGSVADVFIARLRATLPHVAERVIARLRDMNKGRLNDPRFERRMQGEGPYWESVTRLFDTFARKYHLQDDSLFRTPPPSADPPAKQLDLF
jgi:DNA repair photolyase